MDRSENKENVAEIEERKSNLKDGIKKMSETEKQNADGTLKIIEEILDYNERTRNLLACIKSW